MQLGSLEKKLISGSDMFHTGLDATRKSLCW